MRITFVSPAPDLSGGQRVIATYASRLARRGHTVTVVTPPHRMPSLRGAACDALRGRWPRRRSGESHYEHAGVEVRQLDRPRSVVAGDLPDADVVIATWWETAEWVAELPPAKGAQVYFIQHHEVFDFLPVDRVRATWRLPLKKVTISQWLIGLARDEYDDPGAVLVHNSVDTDLFHAATRGKQKRPTAGLLYSSHWMKGCEVSLAALAKAKQHLPELRLIAFGHQHIDPRLLLPDWAEYQNTPPQTMLRSLYGRCDVWLCGSRSEGFHLPPLEAMACRCPVVSTKVGGSIDVIKPGLNGHLVDIGDEAGLADALLRVLRLTDAEWRAMSDAAYATATRYTWDDATDLFEAALVAAANGTWPPAKVTTP